MKAMHGYAITFSLVPIKGLDGEKTYLSSYSITGPCAEFADSIQGSVRHEGKDDALNEPPMLGERRLSSLTPYGAHPNYRSSWSAS